MRVSLKLPWGKQVVRRFHKSDLIRNIYAFAQDVSEEKSKESGDKGGKSFDLFTAYPSMSLQDSLNHTVEEAGVAGSQVIMRWIA